MSQITDTQLIFLDNLIYLDLAKVKDATVNDVINDILRSIDDYIDEANLPAAMTKEQWINLLTSFKNNPANTEFLKNYKVTNYVTNDDDTNGFRAACFVNVNDVTDVAAIFRGTYGGIEWEDDFLMANDVWSEEMDKAIHYINSLPAEYGNNIAVSGHSKGGNKSQYVTLLTDRIGRCVSFDGQGFSQEFIDLYADIIEERKHKITSISGQHDYVNALLFPIASKIEFVQTDCDSDVMLNHCPNKVFDENGNLRTHGTDIAPALYASIISYLTQKPLAEMPDGFATQSISELTRTVIVPILDLNKEEGIDFGELAKSLPLLTLFTKYLFSNALPNLNAFFPTKSIVNLLGNAADNQEFVSNKNNYMSLVEQFVSIYNTVSTQPDNPFDGNYSDHDKLVNEKLEQLLKLEEIRTKLLNIGKDLFSDPAFYKNLSAEDTKLLSEFLEISKNDAHNTKDYDLMLDRLSYILERFGETKTLLYDPLVIDMGKTGFELTDINNGVHFDMDSNGYAEKTGWITGDDAFLALDRNGDGVINNSGELFGDRTLLKNGQYASSGFEALAEFDDNNDGIIDAHDEVYNQLLLWQDKNHDGISTPDELMKLSEAGIKSINLGCNSVNSSDEASGSVLANISSVQFSDGTETSVGEFKFNSNKLDTIDDINISISDDILALPNVRALGTVHSLHYAMAKDSTGTLKNLVEQFVASDNIQEREGLVEQILYFLCDAANVDPASKGAYVDARQLAVLERFLDDTFIGAHSINPSNLAGPELTNLFKKLLSQYYCELSMHNLSKYTSDVISNTDENGKAHINVQLFNALATYDIVHGNLTNTQLGDLGRYLALVDKSAFWEFRNYFTLLDNAYGQIIDNFCGGIIGTDGNDRLFYFLKYKTLQFIL